MAANKETGQIILQFRGIGKRFGSTQALDGVEFAVRRGAVHALVGENGAGKSTLMNICSGALAPDRGTIILNGVATRIESPRAASALGIAMIHQELAVLENLTVGQNIMLGHEPRRLFSCAIDRPTLYEMARRQLQRLQVDIAPTISLAELTIGQRQMVEIAKALSLQARVLIMDEPTSALSSKETDKLFSVIETLRQEHITILYISHRLEEIFRICDMVTVLRDGHHIGTASVDDLDAEKIVHMMVGEDIDTSKRRVPRYSEQLALQVEGVSDGTLLQEISFSVRRGEVFGLFGLLGAGRTELGQTLYGMRPFTAGSVRINGQRALLSSVRRARLSGVAYLPEDRKQQGLFPNQSVHRNLIAVVVQALSRLLWVLSRRVDRVVAQLIERLSIKTTSSRSTIGNLSGGNQQKVILARWMAANPTILILDEPTRGIDVKSKAQIYDLIDELAADGISILLISSELPEIFGVSDTIGVMQRGRLVSVSPATDIGMDEAMRYAAGEQDGR